MLTLTSKANNLKFLEGILINAKVIPQICFTLGDWKNDNQKIIGEVKKEAWTKIPLIVRSSGINEDSKNESLAGHFTSILNVIGEINIIEAIGKVIDSFLKQENENQIFIQPMLLSVSMAGVAFSKDPTNNSEYIIISYDDTTGSTESVTSGITNQLKTYYQWKKKIPNDKKLNQIVQLIFELEYLFQEDSLDIEFGFANDELYLFQVRKLIIKNILDNKNIEENLNSIYLKIQSLSKPHPYLFGQKTVFGVMPDWNPAEIIGIRPRPLALSLYKEIITDNIWAYQRDNYGYKNLRSFPLLTHFNGLPYIDVRISFNSFLPSDLSSELSEKLINYYIHKLIENPSLHDKVEFEIIFSCYTFDIEERLKVLINSGFSNEEVAELTVKLRNLTNNIINNQTGLWKKDIEKIKNLAIKKEQILKSDLDIVSKIYWLIEDCKRYGTLPFAGLARAGFIAVQILKSLVTKEILSLEEYDNFMSSLDTVSSNIGDDFENLSKFKFLEKYGHLRPGTYDILSYRYDETPEKYFDWDKKSSSSKESITKKTFALTLEQLKKIEKNLNDHGLNHNVIGLFDFIKTAIEGREYSKFLFTINLSESISLMQKMGEEYGFNREEISYIDYSVIPKLYSGTYNSKEILTHSINENRKYYRANHSIKLPPIILSEEDVYSFHVPNSEPNFITLNSVEGETFVLLDSDKSISNKILFIQSADPGFDWIFSKEIKGFITMYGGANSHMAIRAGELGIPAIIGAGEILYKKWSIAKSLKIDCANKQVFILK